MLTVHLEDGNSGGEYGYFLAKLAYAWDAGNSQAIADLYRFFEQKAAKPQPIDIEETELHTWFERDRQHVELRDQYSQDTIIEWWDESVSEAVEDGFLDPRDFHSSAYAYALQMGMIPKVVNHG